MAKDYSKGRGKFLGFIELKYIQLAHELYKILFIDTMQMPVESRKTALWNFVEHFFTNRDYETLKVTDPMAYMICKLLDESHFRVQNQSRWRCFDEFYEGRDDLDYEAALENYQKKLKDKKKEANKQQYQKRKEQEYNPEKETQEGIELFNEACKRYGLKRRNSDY